MKPFNQMPTTSSPQRGFSLLEVLIALAVFSFGLLGLAALQTVSLRIGHDSYQRTQATMLAYDIVDRMRANPTGLAAGKYNNIADNYNPGSTNCVSVSCTTDELADFDIRSWHTVIAEKLSQGKGTIGTSGSTRTITVNWRENDLPMQLQLVVQL
ncbi:MAG TPA: type IV pilus modification protein PilV [Gammaproteobacteria bacterium]|nr:type IV pilus modification protein PilV [Gammaproteobacteria bacterium]